MPTFCVHRFKVAFELSKLTPRACKALEFALKESQSLGRPLSCEILFLGLLSLNAGVLHQLLQNGNVMATGLVAHIERHLNLAKGTFPTQKGLVPPSTIELIQPVIPELNRASEITELCNFTYVGTEAIAIAILEKSNTLRRICFDAGFDPDSLKGQLSEEIQLPQA